MEDLLGRHLYPDENVHHLNGVRDDNRPENLELWTRPQPAGIRASDALKWARTIIERYADLVSLGEDAQELLSHLRQVRHKDITAPSDVGL